MVKAMKRKTGTVLVRLPAKRTLRERDALLANPQIQQRIQNNQAAAILLRQARMNAMPVQRNSPNETGYVDVVVNNAVNSTGVISLLATIAQGASVNQRIGKRIFYKSIQWRGYFTNDTTSVTTQSAWILVYDKRPTGALPAITDILVSISPLSMNNDDNSGRFQIVHREDVTLCGNTTAATVGDLVAKNISGFIKFRREVVFKAVATGVIGDIEQGALYYVAVGLTPAGTADATMNSQFRVRFTEQ